MQYQGQGVVNGGLIDFQDNSQRGLPAPNEYPIMHQGSILQSHPVLPGVAAPALLQAAGGVGGTNCFSGPPSFIHISGTTYRPVEPGDPLFHAANVSQPASLVDVSAPPAPSSSAPAGAQVVAASGGSGGAAVSTKILSEAELNRIVDDRVRDRVVAQVSGYLKSKPRSYSSGRQRDPSPSEGEHVSSGRHYHHDYEAEGGERVRDDREGGSRYRHEARVERSRDDGDSRMHHTDRSRAADQGLDHPSRTARAGEEDAYRRGPRTGRQRSVAPETHTTSTTPAAGSSRRSAPAAYDDDLEMQEVTDRVRSANASMSRRVVSSSGSGRGGIGNW